MSRRDPPSAGASSVNADGKDKFNAHKFTDVTEGVSRITSNRFAGVAVVKRLRKQSRVDAGGEDEIFELHLVRENRKLPMDPTYILSVDQ